MIGRHINGGSFSPADHLLCGDLQTRQAPFWIFLLLFPVTATSRLLSVPYLDEGIKFKQTAPVYPREHKIVSMAVCLLLRLFESETFTH